MKILQPMLMKEIKKQGLDHFDVNENGIATTHHDNTSMPLKFCPTKFAKLGFFGMKSVEDFSNKELTEKWIDNIEDHKGEKFMAFHDAIPMHFQFCEIFNTTLVIHIHCRGEKRLSTMIFASLKDLEATGTLIHVMMPLKPKILRNFHIKF